MRTTMKMIFCLFIISWVQGEGVDAALTEEVSKINIHGYFSQGFLISSRNNFILDSKKGTFQFNELGINFTSQVTDRIHMGIQFAARDLGDTGNDKVLIDWAFADYNWRDWLGLRVGKMKLPIGFYSKTRDIDMLRTFILLPQGVYFESFRDTSAAMKGIGVYGVVSPGSLGNISYQASIGAAEIDIDSSSIQFAESIGDIHISKCDVDRIISGCLIWETPLKGLRAGATLFDIKLKCSGNITKDIVVPVDFPPYSITAARKGDLFINDIPKYQIKIFSIEYTWNNLVLAAEYLKLRQEMDIKIIAGFNTRARLNTESYYISGSYRFSNWYELGGYYSVCNKDLTPSLTPPGLPYWDFQKDICVSMRFDLNAHWTFKMEGHLTDGVALCLPRHNADETGAPVFARRWAMFGAKMTYTF
jgi:hypothetical protein